MIKQYKFVSLNKNKNKVEGDTKPDYNVSTKEGEEFIDVGGAWLKKDKNGNSYLSIGFSNAFDKDNNPLTFVKDEKTYQRRGYVLVNEVEFRKMLAENASATGVSNPDIIPF